MIISNIIFIITTLLELFGFLLIGLNVRAFYETYTDLVLVKRIICVIGFVMILIGAIIILTAQIKKLTY